MYAATAEDKAITRASWNKWDVIHTVIILAIIWYFISISGRNQLN